MMLKKIIMLVLGLCLLASSQVYGSEGLWEDNGVIICNAGGDQREPQLISDGYGGVFMVWYDYRDSGTTGYDIYAQRVDSEGNNHAGWPANGVMICNAGGDQRDPQLVSDGSGGAIIVWYDYRDSGTTGYDIYAQRMDSDGNTSWPVNGVLICDAGNNQEYPQMVSDGSGGAIIVWWDERNIGTTDCDIYAQRVDGNGGIHAGWPANGVVICNAGNNQEYTQLVSDGLGGAIIVWSDERDSGTTGTDIYAQKVDSNGGIHAGWPANGMMICNAGNEQFEPQLISDGLGGAIIVWWDGRAFGTTCCDIYAQRVDSGGGIHDGWPANGMIICNAGGIQRDPQMVSDGSGGAIIVWRDNDIHAQRVDSDSGIHEGWPVNGVIICNAGGYQNKEKLVSDSSGGSFVVWNDYRNGDTGDIYAQRMDSDSSIHSGWPENGIIICNAGDKQKYPQLVSDGSGGAIIAWQDSRDADYDICAQRIVRPKPRIVNISPASSPWGEKTGNITISGHSFQDDRGVVTYIKITPTVEGSPINYIEGEELSILSETSLTCKFDLSILSEAGSWYVVMYDSLGQTGTSDTELFYVSPPNQELSWTSALTNVYTGTQNNLAGQINYTAAGHDYLTSLKVINKGTAKAGTDIEKMNLWHKTGGGSSGRTFDPATATRLKSFDSGATGEWNISFGNEERMVDNGDALYITVDIRGGAQISSTCRFLLPALGAKFLYGGSLPDTEKENTYKQVIVRYVNFCLDFQSLAPVNTNQGQQAVRLGRIKLQEATGGSQEVSSILITLYDKAMAEQDMGAVFERIWLEQGGARCAELTRPFSGSRFILSAPIPVPGQAEVEWELSGDYKAQSHAESYFIGLPHEQCINEGRTLSDPVTGRVFPLLGGQVNIRACELKEAFSNYPNPFQAGKEQTKISYYLNRTGQVKIEVLTLRGKLVKVVVDTHENEGMHETKWDGRNERGRGVRSGVYLLRIKIRYADGGKEKLVRKVAVMR